MSRPFIVFDMDDTLYLERDFCLSGYRAVGDAARSEFGIDGLEAAAGKLFLDGERSRIFDRALTALGHAPDRGMVDHFVSIYRSHMPRIALAPDARRYLERMERPGGLITDGPAATQGSKAAALGLSKWLDPILLTGAMGAGAGKPSPVAYAEVERLTGRAGGTLAYVADNPAKDFVTPRARGWRTVMIARAERVHIAPAPNAAHEAHRRIETLDALDAALDLIG